jgi:hypothetical protein
MGKALKFAYILLYSCKENSFRHTYVFHVPFALYHHQWEGMSAMFILLRSFFVIISVAHSVCVSKDAHTAPNM